MKTRKIVKKLAAFALSCAFAFSAVPVFAHGHGEGDSDHEENSRQTPSFLSVTGEVKEISDVHDNEGEVVYREKYITIEGEGTTVLHTNYHTYILGKAIEVGDTVTAYFAANAPALAIYPPRHTVRLIVNGEFANVKIDRFHANADFEGDLVSADGQLRLNFTEQTPILLQDGQDFRKSTEELGLNLKEELDGRLLVVTYGPATFSMPAITIPGEDGSNVSIVVLFEIPVTGPHTLSPEDLPQVEDPNLLEKHVTAEYGIYVNEQLIEQTWREIDGAFYVPFRAVVDALGFGETIVWNSETRTITVRNEAKTITFTIGTDSYRVGDEGLVINNLGHPPIIIQGSTYVPMQFFRVVFGMNNAHLHAGEIHINNSEAME